MLPGAGRGPSRGPGLAPATPAPPRGRQERWPRGSPAASQGGAGQPLERTPLQSRGRCAWGHQGRGVQGLWGAEGAAAGAARRGLEKTPGARRRRRGKAGRWRRARAPQRKGTRWKPGSPRYWARNLPRKKRERVTQALWSAASPAPRWGRRKKVREPALPPDTKSSKEGRVTEPANAQRGQVWPSTGMQRPGEPRGPPWHLSGRGAPLGSGEAALLCRQRGVPGRGGSCNLFGGNLAQDGGCRQWKEGPSTLLRSRSGLTRQPLTAPAKPGSPRGVERVWGQESEDLSADSRSKRRDFISPSVQEGGTQWPLGTLPGPAIGGLQLEPLT